MGVGVHIPAQHPPTHSRTQPATYTHTHPPDSRQLSRRGKFVQLEVKSIPHIDEYVLHALAYEQTGTLTVLTACAIEFWKMYASFRETSYGPTVPRKK